jgi:S-adenosylmethionine decarboxylase
VLEKTVTRLGRHAIAELWDCDVEVLRDESLLDTLFRAACEAAGATILHSHFHKFGDEGGVTGVVVLAESHASVHTWPEHGYAAVDVFMCGNCDPQKALNIIKRATQAKIRDKVTLQRGVLENK